MKKFENKTVVITGGNSGIGAAAAKYFAAMGAKVAVWDVQEKANEESVKDVFFVKTDVSNADEVAESAKQTIAAFSRIDVLINNAGITRDASFSKMTEEQWQQVMDVNLTGVFNCCKAVTPSMIVNNYGRIINTSSVVALYGNYGQANYAATKAGTIAFSKTLARELGKHNITVNAVAPGFIATDMIKTIPEKVIHTMTEKVPLKRLGTAEDVAKLYAFLASDDASFITGTVVSIDGGLTI